MKATDLLKQDHEAVSKLFTKYEQMDDPKAPEARDLANRIFVELAAHMQLEEELFYPAAQEASVKAVDMVIEGNAEHQTADSLIDDLMESKPDGEEYLKKMNALMSTIRHHVEEEETELFPMVEKAMGTRIEDLGREMAKRKEGIQKKAA
jgi:hemerythrin superfamily protein